MAWRLNRALTNFRSAVNARWPDRDKTSDGTIGDPAHQATSSDHNPDADGSVDAWDMDVDGVDVQACIRAALAHESIQYVIYNRRITSRSWGLGIWRTYDGANPHDRHVHFNTRSSHENSTAPWNIEGDDMLTAQEKADWQYMIWRLEALAYMLPTYRGGPEKGKPVPFVAAVKALSNAIGQVDDAVGGELADEFARIEAVSRDGLAAIEAHEAQTAGTLAELRAQVERVDSGEATAVEVVEQVRAMLHAATAPQA